ncbi:unnamed protein product [Absidia cylindrospora]
MKQIFLTLVLLSSVFFTSTFGQQRGRGRGTICAPCGGLAAEHKNTCCGKGVLKPDGRCECRCSGTGNAGCPSFYVCLDTFCKIPVPGKDCGECGFPPLSGGCCGRGIYNSNSGTCFCGTSNGAQCQDHIDCVGKGPGVQYCCNSVCKKGGC